MTSPSLLRSPPLQPRDSSSSDGNLSAGDPATPATPSPLRGGYNPLSSKVTSVLAASYADSDFRDALSLLDERGVQNTAETRRQLRLDLQKEVIESNGQIINEFGRVAEQLKRIGSTIDRLNKSYNEMKSQISEAHKSTSFVLEEAASLMTQRRQVETKQSLLKAFRERFVLSEDEVAALTLNSEPVDDRFFTLLVKAKRVSKDCEVLLGFENQTLGLEIMEQTSKNLNLAFQKLYRWIQREFKTLNLENPQIGVAIRRALRVLAERPTLFQNCLGFFAEAREHILSDAFYTALTGASANGKEDHSVKPIELAAHDPLRYAGDMLAWIHSAAVSEREALEVLFVSDGDEIARDIQAGRANEIWRLADEDGEAAPEFDAQKALGELVDRDLSSAARILRQRVEQIIQANEETILAYKLANLLNFYRVTFAKLLGGKSVLVGALDALETEALRQFRSLVRDHIAALQGDFQHAPADCGPPDFLHDALKQLAAIMGTYETSLTASGNREQDFQPILAEALDPFVEGCRTMAANMRAPDDALFGINCLMAAKAAISPYDFTRARAEKLQSDIDEEARKLVDTQYLFFRMESGLDAVFAALAPLTDKREDVAKIRGLDALQPVWLAQASQGLDDFLPSALMDAVENIQHLQDAQLARGITEEAAERFCLEFEHVEEMLIFADELAEQQTVSEGDVQSLRALFPRTTGEIRVLLS